MPQTNSRRPAWIKAIGIFAIGFGLLTIISGGLTLFVDGRAREAAGNYVPFVLWYNFLAGFVYLLTGIGLIKWRKWAVDLALVIAAFNLLVFAALGAHIYSGSAYEIRTVFAMLLRCVLWLAIAWFTRKKWGSQTR